MGIGWMVAAAVAAVLASWAFNALVHLVWRPYVISRNLRAQGVRGPGYKFFVGNLEDMKRLRAEGAGVVLDVASHDFIPIVQPHLHKWISLYGKTFVYWIGARPNVCMADVNMVKQVLFDRTGLYPKNLGNPHITRLLGKGLLFTDGDEWKRHRTVVHPAFNMDKLKVFTMGRRRKRHDVDDDNSVESISHQSDFEKSSSVPDDTADDSYDECSSNDSIDPVFLKNLRKLVTPSKSKLFRKSSRNAERKRVNDVVQNVNVGSKRTVNRCNLGYFSDIIKSLSVDHKNVIRKYGFGSLLDLDCEPVPRSFAQWIADHVNTRSGDIVLDKKVIPMSPESVHMVLGIPLGGRPMKFKLEATKSAFLDVIGQDSLPTIKFFGNSVMKGNLSDDELVRNFLVVALSVFLCPNSNTFPSTKYLGALIDPKEAKNFDMSKFVFEWLIAYIRKYHRDCKKPSDGPTTLGGCVYKLAVIYLDFLDFGLRAVPIGLPRITVWKHSMIKQFATLDCDSKNQFSMRPVKDISLTVYKSGCVGCCAAHSRPNNNCSEFRSALDAKAGDMMPDKVKDDIVDIFAKFEMQVDKNSVKPAENLVLDIMECLITASGCRSEQNGPRANDDVDNSGDNCDGVPDLGDSDRLNSMNQHGDFSEQSTVKVTSHEDTSEAHPEVEACRPSTKRQRARVDYRHNNSQDSVSSRTRRRLNSLESPRNSPSIQGGNSGSNVDARSLRNTPQPRVDVSTLECMDNNSNAIPVQQVHTMSENPIQEVGVGLTSTQGQTILNKSPINTSSQCFSPHQTSTVMEPLAISIGVVHSQRLSQAKQKSSQPLPPSMPLAVRKSFDITPIVMQTLPFTDDVVEVYNSHMPSQAKHKSSQPIPPSMPLAIQKCIDICSQDSPEVVFRGEKKFIETCNEMCNTSDDLYNQRSDEMNSGKAYGSSSGKRQAQHGPKRLLAPSKYKASPYGDNKIKFSVSSSEVKYHDAIVRIAAIEQYRFNDCINYGRVKVTFSSLGSSLKRRGLVDTYVINAFCRKLSLDNRPRDSKKHHFFHSISEHFMKLNDYPNEEILKGKKEMVRRCFDLACGAKVIHTCEIVFFPTLYDEHWFVFAVLFQHRMFVFLDSLHGEFSNYHRDVQSILIPNFIRTWQEFGSQPNFDFSDFTVYFPKVPSQGNALDCGIFVMKYMELWNPRRQLIDCFSRVDIANIRCLYANQMLFSQHNKLTDSQERVKNFDPKKHGCYVGQA